MGVDKGIIKKSGSWFSYNDTKLGQGRDAAKKCIQDNPELADEVGDSYHGVSQSWEIIIYRDREIGEETSRFFMLFSYLREVIYFEA